MICAIIKGPTIEEAHQQIASAIALSANLVELRLDGFHSLAIADLQMLRTQYSIPMIFALRNASQGGCYAQSEQERLADIHRLIALEPDYFDLESEINAQWLHACARSYPNTKIILSYHHFTETPEDLDAIYSHMQTIPAYYYKIAVHANSSLDAMRLLLWVKQKNNPKLIAISMGMHGQISRILAPLIPIPITYAALADNLTSAPGQLNVKTLVEQYRYRSLTPHTAIYGLIGDPVSRSISDVTHNQTMGTCSLNAIYVKIQVTPTELPAFLKYAQQLRFSGLSVTMPLKEQIIPLLDTIDPHALDIGAVNTLHFVEGKIFGFNTDGKGALNAIEKECAVRGKRILLIGAGGAAKAIAYEAHRRGAILTIVNRDAEKAQQLAKKFHGIGRGLDEINTCCEEGYDILINSTPLAMPIAATSILPQTIVMDINTKPKETEFLKCAKERGCRVIYGYQMFMEQALGQFLLWFNSCAHPNP